MPRQSRRALLEQKEILMLTRRKTLRLAATAVAMPFVSTTGLAQTYPSRSITLVVPFAPGAGTDVSARIVGEHMSRTLGQPIVVENSVGAGGTTGSVRAMRASPDGYTILMGQLGTHAAAVALNPNLPYRPDIDFEPIGMVLELPFLILARRDFPPKDLKEFVSYTKANSEKLNVAHAGVGSITYTFAVLLNSALGLKPTMVPFNGAAPATNALVAGQVDYMSNGLDNAQLVQSALVKAYAIGTTERHPVLPNVPTSIEAGLPEFQAAGWWALFKNSNGTLREPGAATPNGNHLAYAAHGLRSCSVAIFGYSSHKCELYRNWRSPADSSVGEPVISRGR
jgi:tripartite-type tricarboxylate transporter receptor subunit TctC